MEQPDGDVADAGRQFEVDAFAVLAVEAGGQIADRPQAKTQRGRAQQVVLRLAHAQLQQWLLARQIAAFLPLGIGRRETFAVGQPRLPLQRSLPVAVGHVFLVLFLLFLLVLFFCSNR